MKKINLWYNRLTTFITFFIILIKVNELSSQCVYPHDLVSIPGGTFQMGTTAEQVGCSNETVHTVTVSNFLLGAAEVTQGEWTSVMSDVTPTRNPHFSSCGGTCPMEKISWYDAIVYCNRLSALDLLEPCYFSDTAFTYIYGYNGSNWSLPDSGLVYWKHSATGYRLPTESEWEYAARGGGVFPQTRYSGSDSINTVSWHQINSLNQTHPVKQKLPNALNIFDMSGNVWEWCWDNYSVYPAGPLIDPTGNLTATHRIERGGGWNDIECYNRVSNRGLVTAITGKSYNLGFRLSKGAFIANAGPNQDICYAQSTTLIASGGGSYQWSNGLGSLDSVTTPVLTTNTNYVVTVTLGTCTATDEVVVNVSAIIPPPEVIGDSICLAGQVDLSANGCSGGVINWYDSPMPASIINTGNQYTPSISTTSIYYVECELGGCHSELTSVTGEVFPLPPPPVLNVNTPTQNTCEGQIVTITAFPFSELYLYEFFINGISVQGPSQSNTYTLIPSVGQQNVSAIISYVFE